MTAKRAMPARAPMGVAKDDSLGEQLQRWCGWRANNRARAAAITRGPRLSPKPSPAMGGYSVGTFAFMTASAGRVFREPWDEASGTGDLDETWVHGVVIGGMASEINQLGLAHAYAEAAAALVDAAVASREPGRVCYPIFFLYRHALELYFKCALPQPRREALRRAHQGHDLRAIISEFETFLSEESRGALPAHVRDDLLALATMDPDGQGFRYTDTSHGEQRPPLPGEYWVALYDLKRLVEAVLWPNVWWR